MIQIETSTRPQEHVELCALALEYVLKTDPIMTLPGVKSQIRRLSADVRMALVNYQLDMGFKDYTFCVSDEDLLVLMTRGDQVRIVIQAPACMGVAIARRLCEYKPHVMIYSGHSGAPQIHQMDGSTVVISETIQFSGSSLGTYYPMMDIIH